MKVNKFLMLGLTGLAFAACSNDEDLTGKNLDGNGVVSVKIVSPQTKTKSVENATDETAGSKITVKGEITVQLTASSGVQTQTVTADGSSHSVKFYDVKGPSKIEAWINEGNTKGLGTTDISDEDLQVVPTDIPAYGSTEEIYLNGTTELYNGNTYEMYEATVTMQLPVARLEVSGIKHVTHQVAGDADEASCKYQTLTIDGIYLDKVKTTATGNPVDYAMGTGISDTDDKYPILSDKIASASFLAENSSWPTETGKVYAYNFYPDADPENQPVLKIYFGNATSVNENEKLSEPRYAVISSYNGQTDFTFKAGTIYRITNVTLKDKNILGDEEGNILYGVDVTVTEAQWTVAELNNVEWKEQ